MRGFGKIAVSGIRLWAVLGLLLVLIVVMSSCSKPKTVGFSSSQGTLPPAMGGPPGPPPGMGGPGMPMASKMGPAPGMPGMPGRGGIAGSMQPSPEFAEPGMGSMGDAPSSEGEIQFPPVGSAETSLLIIKTGDITIKVKNIEIAVDQIIAIARSSGGFVTNSTFNRTDDEEATPYGTVTVRVPVNAFERVTSRIGKIGEVTTKNLSGEDVTSQVFDLESRLRNKRAEEAQYVEIMQRAKKIPDIVSVSNQLFRVRGEIEQLQGRVKYLRSASDMSSITVNLTEPRAATEKGIPGAWQRAIESLKASSTALLSWVIWVAVFAPYWVAALILLLVLVKLVRKRLA